MALLYSDFSIHDKVPPTTRLDDNIPYGIALPLAAHLPPNTKGGCEGYIDDSATAVLDTPENSAMVKRARLCNLMALHLVCRPNSGPDEPILCPKIASKRKLAAKGGLQELIIYLGWAINTRAFTIGLPPDKVTAWTASIVSMLKKEFSSYKDLATLVRRLEHVCNDLPSARHFMNHTRRIKDHAEWEKSVRLPAEVKKDLVLWIKLLNTAKRG